MTIFLTKADLATATALLEAHFKADISALEARLAKDMGRQTLSIIGAVAAIATTAGVVAAIVHMFL